MNVVIRWIGLVVMTALLALSAAAQEMPFAGPDDLELPNESMLPSNSSEELPSMGSSEATEPSLLVGPPRVVAEPGASESNAELYNAAASPYDMWDSQPALLESSGTWLNRGLWYAEADAAALLRSWQRHDVFLAAQDQNVILPPTFQNPQSLGIGLTTNRTIFLKSMHPGEDAAIRTTLGRFLFRDDDNRDHSAEFTVYSNGDWVEDCALDSSVPNGLFTPFTVSGTNRDFDRSTRERVLYSSRFNSFELNYRVKRRLGRDQMVMDPNGCWRREASNGFNRNYLIGLRFMRVREIFDWRAEDIVVTGDDGRYLINTDNNLFGFQMGEGIEYETGRWSVGIGSKLGLYVNDADATSVLNFTVDDTNDFNRHSTEDELSFMAEASILGRYHLTPNFSLRAGFEVTVLDSLALAPRQINFIDEFNKVETGGSPFYMGGSLGFEGYW